MRLDGGSDGDGFLLRVTDSGPGIAEPEQAFASGWSTKPADGMGRGLGLALVWRAVHRHGGTVSAGRAPAGGAEFRVWFPSPAPL